jgi:hypothetical protein
MSIITAIDDLHQALTSVGATSTNRFRITDAEGGWLARIGGDYLAAPMFLSGAEAAALGADMLTVARLLAEVPARLGHTSTAAYAAALGYGDPIVDLLQRADGLPEILFGRVDALRTEDGFRVLEFNATSETGGMEWVDVATFGWGEDPEVSALLRSADVRNHSVTARLAVALKGLSAEVVGVDAPSVALVGGPQGTEEQAAAWHPLRDQLIAQGIPAVVCGIDSLTVRPSGVYANDTRVHIVYRIFELAQIVVDPQATDLLRQILEAAHRGAVAVFTSLASELSRDKRTVATLTESPAQLGLTPEERATVHRLVPPTTNLATPLAAATRTRLIAERATTILKPARGYAGAGIVAGWEISPAHWVAAVDGIAEPTVAQRRVVPAAEHAIDADGVPFTAESVYGIYYLEDVGFVGGGARVRPYGASFVTHDLPERTPPVQRAGIQVTGGQK